MDLGLGTSAIGLDPYLEKHGEEGRGGEGDSDGEMAGIRKIHITLPAKKWHTWLSPPGQGTMKLAPVFYDTSAQTSTPPPIMDANRLDWITFQDGS